MERVCLRQVFDDFSKETPTHPLSTLFKRVSFLGFDSRSKKWDLVVDGSAGRKSKHFQSNATLEKKTHRFKLLCLTLSLTHTCTYTLSISYSLTHTFSLSLLISLKHTHSLVLILLLMLSYSHTCTFSFLQSQTITFPSLAHKHCFSYTRFQAGECNLWDFFLFSWVALLLISSL